MTSNLGAIALSYSQKLNFYVFPLKPRSKIPATKNGLKDAVIDATIIKEWWEQDGSYNIALRTGEKSGVWVLDVDGDAGKNDLEYLEAIYGNLPVTPTQKTAHGKHYLFAYPIGLAIGNKAKLIKHESPGGLDVRGNGGYIVLAPSIHPDTGMPYSWEVKPSQCPLALAPQWLLDLVVTQAQALPSIIKPVFSSLTKIRHDSSPDNIINDRLNDVIKAPSGQRNHVLNVSSGVIGKVIEFSDITENEAREKLHIAALKAGLDPSEIGPTINSGINFGKSHPYEYGKNKEVTDSPKYLTSKVIHDADGVIIEETKDNTNKFKLLTFDDLLYAPKVEWIIKGVFPKKSFGVMYGPPGEGKTFVGLDMALCISHGLQWHGLDVVQGSVLYIAGEGMGGLPKRLKAWTAQYAPNDPSPPFYAIAAGVNMRDELDVNSIISSIDSLGQKFSLIVIDTVARAILGGDENSSTDMGLFVAACDAIKDYTGATVIGIHHSGKDEDKGMRGSSALLGAVDTVINISQEIEGTIVLKNEKQKDAEQFKDMVFKSVVIATGIDETSIIIEPSEDQTVYQKKVNGKVDLYLEALWDCISEDTKTLNGIPATSLERWRDICSRKNLGGDNPEAIRKGFYRARCRLQDGKSICVDGNLVSYLEKKQ